MGLTTFDTLKFVRRLEKAGVPLEQAEVQAEVLTEAFNVNLDSLVTKEHLATQFAKQNADIDGRFSEQLLYVDRRFAELESKLNVNTALLSIVVLAVVIPLIERWLVL
jgi:DNA-binding transcriptional MerR regulator